MALIITGGTSGASGSAATTKTDGSFVICSGAFGSCVVEILANDGLGQQAPVCTFMAPGCKEIPVGDGITVTARIVGATSPVADIDVSLV